MATDTVPTDPAAVTRRRAAAPRRKTGQPRSIWPTIGRIPLYLLGATMLVPFWWMIIGALKPVHELNDNPPTFWPHSPTLNNFYDPDFVRGESVPGVIAGLFQRWPDITGGYFRFMLNSLFITTTITVGSLIVAALVAYVLTKTAMPGRRAIFIVIISSMMLPWQVTLVPNYLLLNNFGWLDSYQGYIVPALAKAFVVFFLVQYMRSIPDELIHAARIDGAGEWRIWWQIVMPLLRPAMAAMAIFVALAEWNNFLWPLIIINDPELYNLPVALSSLNADVARNPTGMGVVFAAALLTSLPTVIFFFIFQRHFTRGIALSGIKG